MDNIITRRRLLAFAVLAAAVPIARADPPGGEHGHGGRGRDERHDERRDDWHRGHDGYSGPPGHDRDHRGRQWARGQRVPRDARVVYVDDWRSHNLRPPPRGHRWALVDGQWLLVAVATGVIVDILINQ